MTLEQLACEYDRQYKNLCAKIDGLRPLLCIYTGEDLLILRRKIKVYYDMACDCKRVSSLLCHYYDEEDDIND